MAEAKKLIADLEIERAGLIGCLETMLARVGKTDDVVVREIRDYLASIAIREAQAKGEL